MSDVKITEEESEQLDNALSNYINQMSLKELKHALFDEMIYYYQRDAPEEVTKDFIQRYGNESSASNTGKESPCK